MSTVDKYLNESKESQAIRDWAGASKDGGNSLRIAYYGVMQHIETLANELNVLVGDTGEFSKDLRNAVKARDAFRKLTLGKYI